MACHIFLAESEAKQSDPRKEAAGARARNAVEDLNVQVIRSYYGLKRRASSFAGQFSTDLLFKPGQR